MTTRVKFEEAYRKFPPSKFELFYINNTLATYNIYKRKRLVLAVCIILILPMILELIFTMLHLPYAYRIIPEGSYFIILAFISINWFLIWHIRHKRYKNIKNYLRITQKEFQKAINAFYYNNYANSVDFIKSNAK